MIGPIVEKMLNQPFEHGMLIDGNNVAHVNEDNALQHAALVLTNTGYNSIPVLDNDDHFVGIISLAAIIKIMFGLDDINPDKIHSLYVRDVMMTDYPVLRDENDLETALHLLVDHNYIPVVDEDYYFKGIVTRKSMLKAVNYLAHRLEAEYELTAKKNHCQK